MVANHSSDRRSARDSGPMASVVVSTNLTIASICNVNTTSTQHLNIKYDYVRQSIDTNISLLLSILQPLSANSLSDSNHEFHPATISSCPWPSALHSFPQLTLMCFVSQRRGHNLVRSASSCGLSSHSSSTYKQDHGVCKCSRCM